MLIAACRPILAPQAPVGHQRGSFGRASSAEEMLSQVLNAPEYSTDEFRMFHFKVRLGNWRVGGWSMGRGPGGEGVASLLPAWRSRGRGLEPVERPVVRVPHDLVLAGPRVQPMELHV